MSFAGNEASPGSHHGEFYRDELCLPRTALLFLPQHRIGGVLIRPRGVCWRQRGQGLNVGCPKNVLLFFQSLLLELRRNLQMGKVGYEMRILRVIICNCRGFIVDNLLFTTPAGETCFRLHCEKCKAVQQVSSEPPADFDLFNLLIFTRCFPPFSWRDRVTAASSSPRGPLKDSLSGWTPACMLVVHVQRQ